MLRFKRFSVFGAVCMLAAGVVQAQDVAITGKDFESGAADAKLAEIARQAAASGKTVIVTTPPYWQAQVAGKMRAAAPGVQVKTSDAFFENVLVRIVDAEKQAKPEVAKPEVAVAAKPVEKPAEPAKAVTHEEPRVAPPRSPPAEPPAAKAAPAQVAVAKPAPPPATSASTEVRAAEPVAHAPAAPAEVASIAQPSSAAAHPTPATAVDSAAIKRAFENQFNLGRPAAGAIGAVQLQKGDEIFVRGPVRAVVRRERSRVQLFWVEGELHVDRAELAKAGPDHYLVSEPIRDTANPTLRAMHSEPKIFTAQVPTAQVRSDMERHFNDAKAITARMHAEDLRYGDLFYIYRSHAVVFRRTDLNFDRYWLEGPIDLNQAGLIKDGDAWRIVSERL